MEHGADEACVLRGGKCSIPSTLLVPAAWFAWHGVGGMVWVCEGEWKGVFVPR